MNKWVSLAIGLMVLITSTTVYAAVQTIVPSPIRFEIAAGDEIAFEVRYTAASPDQTTGLGLKLYFDSSKLSFVSATNVFAKDTIATASSYADSANGDGDAATNSVLNAAWASVTGEWPSTGRVDTTLYKVTFVATQTFSSATTIRFTADTAEGDTFAATAIDIAYKDTLAPTLNLTTATLALNATGVITPVTDFGVTATDLVDGTITPVGFVVVEGVEQSLPSAGFTSGVHQLRWKATDSAGNIATATQTLAITPQANFIATQLASAGDTVEVKVMLSGAAVQYPVRIPYRIDEQASTVDNTDLDHNASDGVLEIEAGATSSFSFNVTANPVLSGAGQGNLVFTMGTAAPTHAIIGAASTHTVIISAQNIAPSVSFTMNQGATATPISHIAQDAGQVLITAVAKDSAAQTLRYDWSQSDSALHDVSIDNNNATQNTTFAFDPSVLSAGSYIVIVTVSDNGSPQAETTISKRFNVIAGAVVIADSDADGIADTEDKVSEPNRLAADKGGSDTFILESELGTRLLLGDVALEQAQAGAGLENTSLPVLPDGTAATALEVYDFKITGVAQGSSTLIVIPQHTAIPANATYLKSNGSTWSVFSENEHNRLYSAAGTGTGICPPMGDVGYQQGLTEGDYCVQLKIEDGGANDADGVVNGQIADPSAVATEAVTTGGSSSTSRLFIGSMSWSVLAFLLLLVGVKYVFRFRKLT